ncbi:type I restriction enzyme S subunit [Clavibacter sp. B3I6]|uniref:restriction endonuclease subunit S n=1 Tax=Clavibacter sp. B3I6 TaxID=3042268 RepID=UPI002785ABFF|nr:restriction endonuclease subunit S [Clavibacter sp. B3I6]MDQ0744666.1 type I restriction enzyme S subunit [Clavibacter sp. B3I6]
MTMHGGLVDQSEKFKKRIASEDVSTYKVARRGQLVVGFPIDEGVLDFQLRHEAGIVSPAYGVWDADSALADPKYLGRYLRSNRALAYYKSKLRGSTARRRSLPSSVFLELPVFLPPLDEQVRLAAILDRADALRAKRRQVLAHLEALPQVMLNELIGISEYETVPLGSVVTCVDSLRKPVTARDRPIGNIPYYGANGQQGWIDRPLTDESLVLVAEDGGHFDAPERGVAYRIDGPAWVNNHAHVLRPGPRLHIEYLHRALQHYDFRAYISGTTRSKLNQKQMLAASIKVPSLAAQIHFADRVSYVRAQTKIAEQAQSAEDKLFASLQHWAFRSAL